VAVAADAIGRAVGDRRGVAVGAPVVEGFRVAAHVGVWSARQRAVTKQHECIFARSESGEVKSRSFFLGATMQ
jgi:hypothetical protein